MFECTHCHRIIGKVTEIRECGNCKITGRAGAVPPEHGDDDDLTDYAAKVNYLVLAPDALPGDPVVDTNVASEKPADSDGSNENASATE